MSIEIYKVNKLFTIKRVSVCVGRYVQKEGQIDGMFWWGCEQDGMWDGMVWCWLDWKG